MKKITMSMIRAVLFACVLLVTNHVADACTNVLVGKKASVDGSVFITYAADSHVLYGELYYWPAAKYASGTMLDVVEWDTGKALGKIKQVRETYKVVGNMNEHQLAISETTFGGRPELQDTTGILDYGSLIYITLQRAKTAREAIQVMTELVAEYGYYSSGESFSIADPNNIWIMEMIGKGVGNKGAVWIAHRIPDDCISGHANHARITTVDFTDKDNVLFSDDVVDFARKKGYFTGTDEEFDFAAAYNPLDFGGMRFCDARVWSFFRKVDPSMDRYLDYVMGKTTAERMPLYVKPSQAVSLRQVKNFMRDHFEGTPLDMTVDIGAGSFGLPYRWRPLTWEVDGEKYCNERAVATQQTGFSFVAQLRDHLPNEIGGVLWFGVDDAATSVYTPLYCCLDEVPVCLKEGNGHILEFSWTSAFWVFNWVANLAYTKYSYMMEDVLPTLNKIEDKFENEQAALEQAALELYEKKPKKAVKHLTNYSVNSAAWMLDEWKDLGEFLMVKYIDGNVKVSEGRSFKTNGNGVGRPANPQFPGYSEKVYRAIVKDAGEKLQVRPVE